MTAVMVTTVAAVALVTLELDVALVTLVAVGALSRNLAQLTKINVCY